MGLDQERVRDAVRFLRHPRVRETPQDKKVAFLKTKGHSDEEIEEALRQADSAAPVASGALQRGGSSVAAAAQEPPPPPPPSVLGMLTSLAVLGGIGYGVYYAVKKFIVPMLTREEQEPQVEGSMEGDESFDQAYDESQGAGPSQRPVVSRGTAGGMSQQNQDLLAQTMIDLRTEFSKMNDNMQNQHSLLKDQLSTVSASLQKIEADQLRKERDQALEKAQQARELNEDRMRMMELKAEIKELKGGLTALTAVSRSTPTQIAPISPSITPQPSPSAPQVPKQSLLQQPATQASAQSTSSPAEENVATPVDTKDTTEKPAEVAKPPVVTRREPAVKVWQ
eukprot:TRINITY_DN4997_c0_g8_i1.p1 TRINITY_DN4997_c0_g8~~TRINITY_DN4997_c0_g8_i1.p1  ORF type:complete len:338 (-),score=86.41 TRINITY_DN4997_c0_g8_i1:383-1396(-)